MMTFGLGGDATRMLVNRFSLGGFSVTVEVIEPPSTVGGGSYGVFRPSEHERFKTIVITVRHKNQTWERRYLVREFVGNIVFRITNVASSIINNINISVSNFKKTLKNFRIKR